LGGGPDGEKGTIDGGRGRGGVELTEERRGGRGRGGELGEGWGGSRERGGWRRGGVKCDDKRREGSGGRALVWSGSWGDRKKSVWCARRQVEE